MTSVFAIKADKRENTGKSAARKLRNAAKLPANIYGRNQKSHSIAVDYKEVSQMYKKGGFYTQICEITLADKVIKVIPKEVTLHPVTDNVEHVDFYMLNDKEKVKIRANIEFINEVKCAGVKKGGVINIAARKVELLCYPTDIINKITIDLANLHIGESIHINDVNLPDNVEVAKKSAQTIVTIVGRTEETSEAGDTEDTEAETKEGTDNKKE